MEIQLINEELIDMLRAKARTSERLRQNFDLRTTPEDGSQRMLNVLEPGTKVPIHRHLRTSESVICIEGRLDWVIYEEEPMVNGSGFFAEQSGRAERMVNGSWTSQAVEPSAEGMVNGETAADESQFVEKVRFRVCPREKVFGIQVPKGVWHSIEVYEPSAIFEAKDGAYIQQKK